MPWFFRHDKKNEILIHECSKRGNISWKYPPKCISVKMEIVDTTENEHIKQDVGHDDTTYDGYFEYTIVVCRCFECHGNKQFKWT